MGQMFKSQFIHLTLSSKCNPHLFHPNDAPGPCSEILYSLVKPFEIQPQTCYLRSQTPVPSSKKTFVLCQNPIPKANSLGFLLLFLLLLLFLGITSLTMGRRRLGGNDICLLGSEIEEQQNVIPQHRAPPMRQACLQHTCDQFLRKKNLPRTSAII